MTEARQDLQGTEGSTKSAEDWGQESGSSGAGPEIQPLDPQARLRLAQWVLLGAAIMFIASAASFLYDETTGKHIFDAGKTILPPIATLVLGYYFSSK
jgi:hypothetical protein